MSSNYPLGSENDPNAPWNISDKLCRNCDYQYIVQIAMKSCENPDDSDEITEKIDEILAHSTLCPYCIEEEIADLRNDD